jgi:hypothetical protein
VKVFSFDYSRTFRRRNLRLGVAPLAVLVAALFTISSSADLKHKPWIEKDWTKWTEWDCDNILHYSPWAWFDEGGGRENGPIDYDPGFQFAIRKWARIVSALPIRQAELRQLQLQKHYDRMGTQKKQAFDQEHAADLTDGDNGQIRLFVGLSIHGELPQVGSPAYGMGVAGALPPRHAALKLSNGNLVMPTEIKILGSVGDLTGSATEYVFPRIVNGKSLFTADDRMIMFVFGEKLPATKGVRPQTPEEFHFDPRGGNYAFPISSLMYKGKLEY